MAKKVVAEKPVVEKKASKADVVSVVGRRKNAIARVWVYKKVQDGLMFGEMKVTKGDILVNEKHISVYFPGEIAKATYMEPLRITNTINNYAITVRVTGGGKMGQMDAVILGICRALAILDKEKFYPILKKQNYTTRDARVRQRRKVGMGGKSRRKRQSPKR